MFGRPNGGSSGSLRGEGVQVFLVSNLGRGWSYLQPVPYPHHIQALTLDCSIAVVGNEHLLDGAATAGELAVLLI